jgi:hypothetical protein
MALAASSTTNLLSEIEICRFSEVFSEFSASTIDCVNARSLTALGATTATLNTPAAAEEEDVVPPPVVDGDEVMTARTTATIATRAPLDTNTFTSIPPLGSFCRWVIVVVHVSPLG